jgi:hypothetical protein
MWMIIFMVVLSLCSTQIFAQGVTVGDTVNPGGSMLNVKPTPNGPGLSVGDAAHIAVPAPPNGASIQGDLLIGTTSLGNAKAIIDGTGKLVALEVQGTFYFIQLDKGPIQKTLDGKCWLLVPEPQPDGLTALPKYYLVTCPY